MQRFKVYADEDIIQTQKKPKLRERPKLPLREIKNTIVTRSKFSDLNSGLKNVRVTEPYKPKPKPKRILKKPTLNSTRENPSKNEESPEIIRKRRLSSVFRVSEYANDIYQYLQKIEDKYPIAHCARIEKKFGECTRFALVDWLVEINEHFKFIHETLQLCVAIIDRYIPEEDSITRNDLQLVALASAFLASKYEEIVPMEINDLLYVCDSSLSTTEILKMEMKIVDKIQYSLGRPVPAHFIRRYSIVASASITEQCCAFYLSDVSLMSYKLCHMKPSITAASSLYIAFCVSNKKIDKNFWSPALIKYSTYEVKELEECVTLLASCFKRIASSKFGAIQRKYTQPKNGCVNSLLDLMPIIDKLAM